MFLGGAPSPGMAIRLWNDALIFALFTIVIYLLDALYPTLLGLETAVQDRTLALREEMEDRRRLEHQILDLSERERQAFGHELHDVVCQELASITIAGNLLTRKLAAKGLMEAEQAREITRMVDGALNRARSVARGFFAAGFSVMGLAEALREIARNVTERTGVNCTVAWQDNLLIQDEEVAMHFFRIAQEGIQNALKHAEPSNIRVSLDCVADKVRLVVEDDGVGFTEPDRPTQGLGLRIMRHRTSLIGGDMHIEAVSPHGTRIICSIPLKNVANHQKLAAWYAGRHPRQKSTHHLLG